jgi:hypothetical protein
LVVQVRTIDDANRFGTPEENPSAARAAMSGVA